MKKKKKKVIPLMLMLPFIQTFTQLITIFFPFLSRGDTAASLGDSNEPLTGAKKKFIYKIFNFFFGFDL